MGEDASQKKKSRQKAGILQLLCELVSFFFVFCFSYFFFLFFFCAGEPCPCPILCWESVSVSVSARFCAGRLCPCPCPLGFCVGKMLIRAARVLFVVLFAFVLGVSVFVSARVCAEKNVLRCARFFLVLFDFLLGDCVRVRVRVRSILCWYKCFSRCAFVCCSVWFCAGSACPCPSPCLLEFVPQNCFFALRAFFLCWGFDFVLGDRVRVRVRICSTLCWKMFFRAARAVFGGFVCFWSGRPCPCPCPCPLDFVLENVFGAAHVFFLLFCLFDFVLGECVRVRVRVCSIYCWKIVFRAARLFFVCLILCLETVSVSVSVSARFCAGKCFLRRARCFWGFCLLLCWEIVSARFCAGKCVSRCVRFCLFCLILCWETVSVSEFVSVRFCAGKLFFRTARIFFCLILCFETVSVSVSVSARFCAGKCCFRAARFF